MVVNALTIDVEDWFCTKNLSTAIKYSDWGNCELRIRKNTFRLLELLNKYNNKATFFVLGWIAERIPELILEIDKNGYEIASHGYSHISLLNMNKEEFDADLKKALKVKKEIVNKEIKGYRSPSFSVTKSTMWAFDVLIKNNIVYDSSVFPFGFHPEYGISYAPTSIYSPCDSLTEIPLSVCEIMGLRIPFGGGGYFRFYPYFISNFFMRLFNKNNKPFVFYLHPWEIDEYQPKVKVPLFNRVRHYYNIRNTYNNFEKVLKEYKFSTMIDLINNK